LKKDHRRFQKILIKDCRLFPIQAINKERQSQFSRIVSIIIEVKSNDSQKDTNLLEKEIDQLVYQLYGLTDKEIEIVESSFNTLKSISN